jgi:hypothetical protein
MYQERKQQNSPPCERLVPSGEQTLALCPCADHFPKAGNSPLPPAFRHPRYSFHSWLSTTNPKLPHCTLPTWPLHCTAPRAKAASSQSQDKEDQKPLSRAETKTMEREIASFRSLLTAEECPLELSLATLGAQGQGSSSSAGEGTAVVERRGAATTGEGRPARTAHASSMSALYAELRALLPNLPSGRVRFFLSSALPPLILGAKKGEIFVLLLSAAAGDQGRDPGRGGGAREGAGGHGGRARGVPRRAAATRWPSSARRCASPRGCRRRRPARSGACWRRSTAAGCRSWRRRWSAPPAPAPWSRSPRPPRRRRCWR